MPGHLLLSVRPQAPPSCSTLAAAWRGAAFVGSRFLTSLFPGLTSRDIGWRQGLAWRRVGGTPPGRPPAPLFRSFPGPGPLAFFLCTSLFGLCCEFHQPLCQPWHCPASFLFAPCFAALLRLHPEWRIHQVLWYPDHVEPRRLSAHIAEPPLFHVARPASVFVWPRIWHRHPHCPPDLAPGRLLHDPSALPYRPDRPCCQLHLPLPVGRFGLCCQAFRPTAALRMRYGRAFGIPRPRVPFLVVGFHPGHVLIDGPPRHEERRHFFHLFASSICSEFLWLLLPGIKKGGSFFTCSAAPSLPAPLPPSLFLRRSILLGPVFPSRRTGVFGLPLPVRRTILGSALLLRGDGRGRTS